MNLEVLQISITILSIAKNVKAIKVTLNQDEAYSAELNKNKSIYADRVENAFLKEVPIKLKSVAQSLNAIKYWSAEELLPLLALERNEAGTIAISQAKIRMVAREMEEFNEAESNYARCDSFLDLASRSLTEDGKLLSEVGRRLALLANKIYTSAV